jgi:hypothetical protein
MPIDTARLREAREDFERLEQLASCGSFLLHFESAPLEPSGGHWSWLRVPDDQNLLTRLCTIAAKAAKACGQSSDADWFKLLLQAIDVENTGWSKVTLSDGSSVASYSAYIDNPVGHSIALCHTLEERALMPAVKESESRKANKTPRRNIKYETIDTALRGISEARPKNHKEVFRFLDERNIHIPNRQPFKSAGGWLKGFQKNPHIASAWLSQTWGRLGLPAFARGPKK